MKIPNRPQGNRELLGVFAFFLLTLSAFPAAAGEPPWWTQMKRDCRNSGGSPVSENYEDWRRGGGCKCPPSASSGSGQPTCPSGVSPTTSSALPSVPAAIGATPQQQLGIQAGMLGAYMIGQGLHSLFFGSPEDKARKAQEQAQQQAEQHARWQAQQQVELAAQQLYASGTYLFKHKNYAGAITEFQKALTYSPYDRAIINSLALARRALKDTAVAGQTSSALTQLLGNAPANTGLLEFPALTHSSLANPNASALSLVNLDSDTTVVDLRDSRTASLDSALVQGGSVNSASPISDVSQTLHALDIVFGNGSSQELKRQLEELAASSLAQHSEPTSLQSAPAAQTEAQNQKTDAEQATKEALDQVLGQNQRAAAQLPIGQLRARNAPQTADTLGNDDAGSGRGIPGLPGIYTEGPGGGQGSSGSGQGGLQRQLGDASSSSSPRTSAQAPAPTRRPEDSSQMTPDVTSRVVASESPETQDARVVGAQSEEGASRSVPGASGAYQPRYSDPGTPQVVAVAPGGSAQSTVGRVPSPVLGQLSEIARHSEAAAAALPDQASSMEARVGFDQPAAGAVDLPGVKKPLVVHTQNARDEGAASKPSLIGSAASRSAPVFADAVRPNRLTLPSAPSPAPTSPCRDYKPYVAGVVEGTTWIAGFNGPRDSANAESVRKEEFRRLFDQLRLAGKILKEDLDAVQASTDDARDEKINNALKKVFDPTNYDFLIGVGASTELDLNEAQRVLTDSNTEGEISTHQSLYASLRGRQFAILDCHSNGAMVCLAALRGDCPDAKAVHVRLFAPQITSAAAREWQHLIETGRVGSVELFINKGDPITPLSYASAQAITPGTLRQALARATGGSVAASLAFVAERGLWTVGADVAAMLSTYERVPAAIHRDAPGIYMHSLFDDCREKDHQDLEGIAINKALALASLGPGVTYDWNWNCHGWMRYQKLIVSRSSVPVAYGTQP